MEGDDLERVLINEFGADPKDRASIEKAYKAFWADEQARKAAGKPTRHDEEEIVRKVAHRRAGIERFGLDSENPKQASAVDEAWQKEIEEMRGRIAKLKKGIPSRPEEDFGARMENSPAMRSIADKTLRYGPPTAVGAYAGHELTEGASSPRDMLKKSYGEDPTGEWPTTPRPLVETPTPKGRTIPQIVGDEIGDAKFSKYGNAARLGVHSVFGPLGAAGFETKKGKAVWLAPQAILGLGAYDDMAKADDRLKFWEAMQKGYIDKLPTLDHDAVE